MYTKYSGETTARILEEIADEIHSDWVLPAIEEGHIDRTAVEIEQALRQCASVSRRRQIYRAKAANSKKTKRVTRKPLKTNKIVAVPRLGSAGAA